MLAAPALPGYTQTSGSASSYAANVLNPVPPGTTVIVFCGSASTTATYCADSQGNVYAPIGSKTGGPCLQVFASVLSAGLNPLAGDYWALVMGSTTSDVKTIGAVALTGAGPVDVAVTASGSSASPSASGTAANGNEIVIAWLQSASAATWTAPLTQLGPSPGATAWSSRSGALTAAASIASAPWAMIMLTYPAAQPAALGNQAPPSGGAQLPPYPALPAPRTWSPADMLLTPLLRADPGNALTLLANPPLVIAGQTMTTQSVPNSAVTTLALDTELADAWQSHAIPARQIYPPLAGWYLAEGFVFLNDTTTGTTAAAGIQVTQAGVVTSCDGGKTSDNGVNFPVPGVTDLVQANPATGDSIALYVWQNSGGPAPVASAWLTTEWVAALSGTVVSPPVPAAGWTSGATSLLLAVAAGAGTLAVADPTGIVTGGTIGLDAGNAAAENVSVTSVSGQQIGIGACAYPHPAAAPVAVPVSAAFMNHQVRDKIRFLSWRPIARMTSQGTSQTIPSQAWPAFTAITMNGGATVDSFGGWTSARYTFPVSGCYYVYGQAYLGDASSPVCVSAGLSVSGGAPVWGDRVQSAGNSGMGVCATIRRTLRVQAGQWVQLTVAQASGGSLPVLGSAADHSRLITVWRSF